VDPWSLHGVDVDRIFDAGCSGYRRRPAGKHDCFWGLPLEAVVDASRSDLRSVDEAAFDPVAPTDAGWRRVHPGHLKLFRGFQTRSDDRLRITWGPPPPCGAFRSSRIVSRNPR